MTLEINPLGYLKNFLNQNKMSHLSIFYNSILVPAAVFYFSIASKKGLEALLSRVEVDKISKGVRYRKSAYCQKTPSGRRIGYQTERTSYWIRVFNRLHYYLFGDLQKVRSIHNDDFEIGPSYQSEFNTQFDKPDQLLEVLSEFTWKVKLSNSSLGQLTRQCHVVYFKN